MKVAEWNCDCEIQAIYMINYGCKLNACRYLLLIVCYDVEYVFHTVKYTSYANHFFLLLFVFGRGQKSIEQIFEYTKAAATAINGTKCGTKIIPLFWLTEFDSLEHELDRMMIFLAQFELCVLIL